MEDLALEINVMEASRHDGLGEASRGSICSDFLQQSGFADTDLVLQYGGQDAIQLQLPVRDQI